MSRHPLNEKSFELFDGDYLDRLEDIYDIADNAPRPLEKDQKKLLKKLMKAGSDDNELLVFLLTLPRFPIKDSYVSSFAVAGKKQSKDAVKLNPNTVKRICDKVRSLGYAGVLKACTAPIDPSRQNGAKFRTWLNRTYTSMTDSDEFINEKDDGIFVFDGSDDAMNTLAKRELCTSLPRKQENDEEKGVDLLLKYNKDGHSKYILAEAKFLTHAGGAQNNQLMDAIAFIKSDKFKPKKNIDIVRCIILDGVCWMNWKKNKMSKQLKGLDEKQPAFSALYLDEFIKL
jgi:hypothetical protein